MIKWIKKKLFSSKLDEIKILNGIIASQGDLIAKQNKKISELVDLRHELSLRLDKTGQKMTVQAIVWKEPAIIIGEYQPHPCVDTCLVKPVRMELGFASVYISHDSQLFDASFKLRHLVADYCADYIREAVLKEVDFENKLKGDNYE